MNAPLTRVALADDVVWQELEGEIVLLDVAGGRYSRLNRTGGLMWKALLETPDVAGAEASLQGTLPTDAPTLHRDLHALVDQLVAKGLLRPVT